MALSLLKSLKPVAGRALQIALNRALALDPDTRHALASLDGRHIDLPLEAPSLAMRISVDGDQLLAVIAQSWKEDGRLSRPGGLLVVLAHDPVLGAAVPLDRVHIVGDPRAATKDGGHRQNRDGAGTPPRRRHGVPIWFSPCHG